jgi:hypothetical protein
VICVDLRNPIYGDPVPLLDGERVIGRLQLDIGPEVVVPEMYHDLEILGARVERQLGRLPSEEGTDMGALRLVEAKEY